MIYKNISLLIYFFSYALQILDHNFFFISLIISTFILYEQIIKKKDDLFKIFLVLLPSLTPLVVNNIKFDNSIFFFTAIDPTLIASFLFLYRNCLIINLKKISLIFLLYSILLLYAFVHLIIIYLDGQYSNMGLTYNFKAVLYVCAIFTIYNNDFSHFKKQILNIVILSLIILNIQVFINQPGDNKIVGHLIFLTTAFLAFIIYYKINLLNILIYLPSLFFIKNQSITLIAIFLVSHLLIFLSKFRVVFNKFNLIFLINFQVIFLISFFFLEFIYENYNVDNYFYTKFLYDRLPLYISSLERINYFNFRFEPLIITAENQLESSIWDSGSHNYFLNTAVALGLIPAVLLLIIINLFLIRVYNKIKNNFHITDNLPKMFFITLISSFAVFSATGNAYSGSMGLLLFLLFGCLNSVINSVKKKQQGFRKNN
jgi:hypothetical protein